MTQALAGSFPLFVNPVDTVCHAPERNRCLDRARFLCAQAHRHEHSLAAIWFDLDRKFIKVLPADKRAYSVVKMISALGRELGMTVVAEGVETQAQWECLQAAGIDATQGWLHAQPMAGTVLFDWLQGNKHRQCRRVK